MNIGLIIAAGRGSHMQQDIPKQFINIYDNNSIKYIYYVFNKYEVDEGDLSPISDYTENTKELTLITCNNFNSKRIIVKAKQKGL